MSVAAIGILFVFAFLVIGIGGALLLYYLVEAERDDRRAGRREEVERIARQDREERR